MFLPSFVSSTFALDPPDPECNAIEVVGVDRHNPGWAWPWPQA